MRKDIKKFIDKAYEAPLPSRKREFLQELNYPKTRWSDFVISQFGYIQKKVWILSALLFFAVLFFKSVMNQGDIRLLWAVSALIPFLALTTVMEATQSIYYGFAELQMTTRYNFQSVILVRMTILGIENLFLLCAFTPVITFQIEIGILKTGIYLLVPYLLTCCILFVFVNSLQTKNITFYCAVAAVTVSGMGIILSSMQSALYKDQYFILWLAALSVLLLCAVKNLRKLIKNMEELTWNSFLTV